MAEKAIGGLLGMAVCWVGILMLGNYVHGFLLEQGYMDAGAAASSNSSMAFWVAILLVLLLDIGLTFVVARWMLKGEAAVWAWIAGGLGTVASVFGLWAWLGLGG